MSDEFMVTYRRDDGMPCGEAERWTTDDRYLQDETDYSDAPVGWIAEQWVRVGVQRFTLTPGGGATHSPTECGLPLGSCPPCAAAFQLVGSESHAPDQPQDRGAS